MKVVTAGEMQEIDRRCAQIGLPTEVLMENAGRAVARAIKEHLGETGGKRFLVLVGPGNNGGDGLVAARYLHDWGAEIYLYLASPREDHNYKLTQERGISAMLASQDENLSSLENWLSSTQVVIDALFGTGKARPLEGLPKRMLEKVIQEKKTRPELVTVAVDLPSGLNPDTGAVGSACLCADLTVTLGFPKPGLYAFPGREKAGEIVVADIGIPPYLADDVATELLTSRWAKSVLPARPLYANKGTFGKVMVVAGSINYIGAAYLACSGAMRVGAGLVTLATPASLQPVLASKLAETTYVPLPESQPGIIGPEAVKPLLQWLSGYDALLVGCGLGQNQPTVEFVISLLLESDSSLPSLVLDADALNALSRFPDWWNKLGQDAILTPHPGEMARLMGKSVAEIQADRLGMTRKAAGHWQKTVALKGAHSIIANAKQQAWISPMANPGLASAGTGDVLAGAIAGLLAQNLPPLTAAACGVYLHAQAGEMVKKQMGDTGMLAGDLLPALPIVIRNLKRRVA